MLKQDPMVRLHRLMLKKESRMDRLYKEIFNYEKELIGMSREYRRTMMWGLVHKLKVKPH